MKSQQFYFKFFILILLGTFSYSDTLQSSGQSAAIIVNKSALEKGKTADTISINDLIDIFTKKKTFWGDRTEIILVTHPSNSIPNKVFIQDVLGLTPYQYRSKIERNVYKGRSTPSVEVESEEKMVEYILKEERAVGYMFNYILVKNNERIVIIKVQD